MKRALSYAAGIIAFAIGLVATSALAQTTAVGPYYATPSWDQQLPTSTRFIVLSNWASAAVLDRETGLIWEKSPDGTLTSWNGAQLACNTKIVGGRMGWRLPSIQELASLIDPAATHPALPPGHPFTPPDQDHFYWSATTTAIDPSRTWAVVFGVASVANGLSKSLTAVAWCVRGGSGVDPQ